MRRALRRAAILAVGCVLAAGWQQAGGDPPAAPLAAASLAATAPVGAGGFNSEISLLVWTVKNGEYTVVGETPAARPLVIPAGAEWGVTLLEDTTETALLEARRHLLQKAGRQLSLVSWANKDEEFALVEEERVSKPLTIPEGVRWAVTLLADRRRDVLIRRFWELDHDYSWGGGREWYHAYSRRQQLEGITGTVDLFGSRATDTEMDHQLPVTARPWFWLVGTFEGSRDFSRLNLGCTRVTDAGLAVLKEMDGLQALNLYGTQVTDAGLAHLKELPNLQRLDLEATQVTDGGLVYLGGMHGLRTLSLAKTGVTDAGLIHMEDLHGLRTLNLRGTKVTWFGVRKLQGALPECFILEW